MNTSSGIEINKKANLILEAIMAYARLDFNSSKLEIDNSMDVFDGISSGVNMLGEELKENVFSLKEKEHLLKEIHHRVKNNMQIISSMLRLQFSNEDDERVIKMIQDSQNRIYAMALVHEMLYSNTSFKDVDFSEYLSSLTKNLFESYLPDNHKISLELNFSEKTLLEIDQLIPLGLMINEIITNSLKYAFENYVGKINIEVNKMENNLSIDVTDNGKGFEKDFNTEKDTNLGMQLIFLLADQIDGTVKINRDSGVAYKITFKS